MKPIIATLLLTVSSTATMAGERETALAAAFSGNPFLISGHLTDKGATPAVIVARQRLLWQSGMIGNGAGVRAKTFKVQPVIGYDANTNGGFDHSEVEVAGMTFNIPEDYVARTDVVFGAQAGASIRGHAFGKTAYAASGTLHAVRAAKSEDRKITATLQGCSTTMLTYKRFFEICSKARHQTLSLGESTTYALSATGHQHVVFLEKDMDATAGIERVMTRGAQDTEETIASVGATIAMGPKLTLRGKYSVGVGEDISAVALVNRADVGVTFKALDRKLSVNAYSALYEGGLFLGDPIEKRVTGFGVNMPVTDEIGFTAEYSQTMANSDFLSTDAFNLTFNWNF